MSIATEITRLQSAKADIKTAIEAKGVTVPSNATLDDYDTYVSQIQTGGTNKLPQLVDGSITSVAANDLTGITTIRSYAFYGCSSLTNIVIPSTVTYIGGFAFYECNSLASITLPRITNIYASIFYNCSSLTSVTIPDSVSHIYNSVFRGCTLLTALNFEGTKAQWNAITFESNWKSGSVLTTVHCSDGDITL